MAIIRNFRLPEGIGVSADYVFTYGTIQSTNPNNGSIVSKGGVGVGNSISIGGRLQLFNGNYFTAFESSASGNTVYTLPATTPATGTSVLQSNSSGILSWVPMIASGSGGGAGTVSLGTQYQIAYYSGTAATVVGSPTFTNNTLLGTVSISHTTASTGITTGALVVNGGVGIAGTVNIAGDETVFGRLNYTQSTVGIAGTTVTPQISFIGQDNNPITLSVLSDNTLSFEGSSGQLFSINNNLSSGTIFSVNDISGIPIIRANANGTLSMGEFAGSVGVGLSNPSYKLHIAGDTNLSSGYVYRINGTSVLSASSLGTGVTNSSLTSVGIITSGTWSGSTITGFYGGTGYTNYSKGDILVGAGNTFIKLNVGTDNYVLTASSSSETGLAWSPTSATGITTLNSLTSTQQYFAIGTSGSGFNISSSGSTHTFNIPLAGSGATGLISTQAQTIAGQKTFTSAIIGDLTGTATTANYAHQSGYATTSGLASTATLALSISSIATSANADYNIPFFSGTALSTNSNLYYNPSTGRLGALLYAGTWAGNIITSFYGGTGYSTYSTGDLLVGAGSTLSKLAIGTNNSILVADSSAPGGIKWANVSGFAITNINGLTASKQDLAFGYSGTVPAFSSSGSTHTLNIPIAGTGSTGLVSTQAQSFAGIKTFTNAVSITDNTGSGSFTTGALVVSGGVGIGGTLNVQGDLNVQGTFTTINSTTITVADKNIELGFVATPSDLTAQGGGITLRGATDKSINWYSGVGWSSSESWNLASGNTYKIDGTTVLSATSLGTGITNSSLTALGTITTGVWAGTLITAYYGGTGYNSYSKGDILVGAGNTFIKLNVGLDNFVLTASSTSATGLTWSPTAATGITTLNSLTATQQDFATGTSGSGFNISSSGSTHTFNIPIAGTGATGLVSTLAQSFAGVKTFTNDVIISSSTASTFMRNGALQVYGGVGISGQLSFNQAAMGFTGILTNPSLAFIGTTGSPITLSVLPDNSLSFEGSSGQLFSIDNNLTSGEIFAVSDISGLPIISAYANQNVTIGEFGGNLGIGLSNPFYKLQVIGSVGFTSNIASTSTSTGTLIVGGGVGIGGSLNVNSASSISGVRIDSGVVYGDLTGTATTAIYAHQSGYAITSGTASTSTYAAQAGYAITSGSSSTANTATYAHQSGYGLTSGFATTASYSYQSGYGLTSGLATTANYAHQSGYATTSGFATTATYSYQSGYAITSGIANSSYSSFINVSNANSAHPIIFSPITGSSSGAGLSLNTILNYNPSSNILYTSGLAITATTASSSTSSGALTVAGGVGISGRLSFNQASFGTTGIATNPTIAMIGSTGDPIYLSVLEDNTISFEGSQGQLFSITPNLSTGYIYSVNDITGIPLLRANANANVTANEYAGNFGIGLSNPGYKLHVVGSVGFTSNISSTSTSSGTLVVTGGVGIGGSLNVNSPSNISSVILNNGNIYGNLIGTATTAGFASTANYAHQSGYAITSGSSNTSGYATTSGLATTATYSHQAGYAITSGSSGFATTATYAYQSGYAITSESSNTSGYATTSGLATTATYAHQSGYALTSGSSGFATTSTYAYQSGYAITSGSSNTSGYATTSGLATTATYSHQSGYGITAGFATTANYAYQSGYGLTSGFATTAGYSHQSGYATTSGSSGLATTATYAHQSGYAITSGLATTSTYAYQSGYGLTSGLATTATYAHQSGYAITSGSSGTANTANYAHQSGYATTAGLATTATYSYQSGYGLTAGLATSSYSSFINSANANSSHPLVFAPISGSSSGSGLSINTTLNYNPSTNILYSSGLAVTASTISTSSTSGALTVVGGLGVGSTSYFNTDVNIGNSTRGRLYFSQATLGSAGTTVIPSMAFIGATNSPITLSVLPDNSLSFDGSSGQLFSINNNLSTGWIFSINDISGLPIFRANADLTVAMGEYGGNTGIGLSNPSYKLHVNGDTNLSSGYVFRINGTSVLSSSSLGTGVTNSNLTAVGTITTGTWAGSTITSLYGGTGIAPSFTVGDILYANTSTTWGRLTANSNSGYVLTSAGSGATPTYVAPSTLSVGLATTANYSHQSGYAITSGSSNTSGYATTSGFATTTSYAHQSGYAITSGSSGLATTATYAYQSGYGLTSGFATTANYAYQSGYAITSSSSNSSGFATTATYAYQSGYGLTSGLATTATYSHQSGYAITSGSSATATTATYAHQSGYAITSGFATTASYSYQSGYGLTSGFATTSSYSYQSGYGITAGLATTATYAHQAGYGLTAGFATTASYAYQSGYGLTSGLATTANYAHQSGYAITSGSSGLATTAIYSHQSGYAITSGFATTASYSYQSGYGLTSGLATTANYAHQSGYAITSGLATTANYSHQSGYAITSGFATSSTSVYINNASANSFHPIVFTPIVGSSSGAGLSTNSTVSYNPSTNYLYTSGLAITASTASTSVSTGALLVNGGVGISGQLTYNTALIGTTGISSQPTMTFIGANGDPIKLRVLDDSTLAFSGSQGQLFSISPVLNTGYIFSVNDISGVPLLRANADANVTMGEFAGNIGIGLSNPAYKLHVTGSVGFTSSTPSTSPTTGALVVSGGVGIGGSASIAGRLQLFNGSNYTAFVSSAVGNTVYTLPATSPATGSSVLQATSAGVMSWVSPSGLGISVGGVIDGSVQYKQGSGLGATNSFFFNTVSNGLRLGHFPGEEITSGNSAALLIEQAIGSFNGSLNGTLIAANASPGFTGDLINLQLNAISKFKITTSGAIGMSSGITAGGDVNITSNTSSTSSSSGALVVSGGVGIGGTLFSSSSYANSLSGVVLNNGVVTSGSWAGSLITGLYGGTGFNSYTKGDLLVGAGTTLIKHAVGTQNQILIADLYSGSGLSWATFANPTYGSFYSTTSQPVVGAGATTLVNFNSTYESNRVSIIGGAGTSSRVQIQDAGPFSITFSAQINLSSGTQPKVGDFWFRVNGVDVPQSNTEMTITGKDYQTVITVNFVYTFANNDYFEIAFSSLDTNYRIEALTGLTNPPRPDIPSIILSVLPVTHIVGASGAGISGILSINGSTSSQQYFVEGHSGTNFNIQTGGGTHTFNIPYASTGATGLVTTLAQSFAGVKTFTNDTVISSSTASTSFSTGALLVTGGVGIGGTLNVQGDLNVQGTFTTINSTTITVADKNIELGVVSSPTDITAQGGGITLRGASDKTINWYSGVGWSSSESWNLASGNTYKINGTSVLSSSSLGTGVTNSSLTALGTITTGVWAGTSITALYGGTGLAPSFTVGDILYANTSTTWGRLPANSNSGYVLTSAGSGSTPTYVAPSTLSVGLATTATYSHQSGYAITSGLATTTTYAHQSGYGLTSGLATTANYAHQSGYAITSGSSGFASTASYSYTSGYGITAGLATTATYSHQSGYAITSGSSAFASTASYSYTSGYGITAGLASTSTYSHQSGYAITSGSSNTSGYATTSGLATTATYALTSGYGITAGLATTATYALQSGYAITSGSSGLATTATNINVVSATTNASHPVLFTPASGTASGAAVSTESAFVYNPSTDILSVSGLAVTSGTASTTPTTGALTVLGGVGITGRLSVGIATTFSSANVIAGFAASTTGQAGIVIQNASPAVFSNSSLRLSNDISNVATFAYYSSTSGVSAQLLLISNDNGGISFRSGASSTIRLFASGGSALVVDINKVEVNHFTASTSTSTGALVVSGGVGIGGSIFTSTSNASSISGVVLSNGAITNTGTITSTGVMSLSNSSTTALSIKDGSNNTKFNVNTIGGVVSVSSSTASTNTTSGALVVTGGVGIGGSLYVASATAISGVTINAGVITGNLTGTATTATYSHQSGYAITSESSNTSGYATTSGFATTASYTYQSGYGLTSGLATTATYSHQSGYAITSESSNTSGYATTSGFATTATYSYTSGYGITSGLATTATYAHQSGFAQTATSASTATTATNSTYSTLTADTTNATRRLVFTANGTGSTSLYNTSTVFTNPFNSSVGASVFTGSGSVNIRPGIDATNGVSIGNSSGTPYVYFDTINGRIGINQPTPLYDLHIVGELSATNKSFVIDHPTKPDMTLRHGSLEGPENGVYVRGKLINENIIELPDYWLGLVDDETITVSLTPIGKFSKLYVEKIENYKVYVNVETGIVNCHFVVYGERKDIPKLDVEY